MPDLTNMKNEALDTLTKKIKLSADETVTNIVEPDPHLDQYEDKISDIKDYIDNPDYPKFGLDEFGNINSAFKNSMNTNSYNDIYKNNSAFFEPSYDESDPNNNVNRFVSQKIDDYNTVSDNWKENVDNWFSGANDWIDNPTFGDIPYLSGALTSATDAINKVPVISPLLKTTGKSVMNMARIVSDSFLEFSKMFVSAGLKYNDGVTETSFGNYEATTWAKFIADIYSGNAGYKINVMNTTPLDSGSDSSNIYGNMMLGCPPTFLSETDPLNRTMINTFVKDSKFVSLTPGLPQFHGSRYNSLEKTNILSLSRNTKNALDYLLQNGVSTLENDKRYYTFRPEFGKFYSYLETMLNTIWLKLGLGTTDDGGTKSFNLFTFFDSLTPVDTAMPKAQYQSAIGFFVNPTGIVTENISSDMTSMGSELANDANDNARTFQNLNYLTGMGAETLSVQSFIRRSGVMLQNVKNYASQLFENTINGFQSGKGIIGKIGKALIGASRDYIKYNTESDMGATLQAYGSVNGMKVMYPELWSNTSYSKSINVDFNFTSPYGDPMSIFKYVYVPFCTLLCFTLPRQADDNGYVSPFFVRADIPGMSSVDLGLITNMSYTKGGPQGLFTKDGLPRSISGSFNIEDLYLYLAMSRRINFLSANPSYTSFLDSMTGFSAIYNDVNNKSSLNEYFKKMLNRINGTNNMNGSLWNTFDIHGRASNGTLYARSTATRGKFNVSPKNINWLRKV